MEVNILWSLFSPHIFWLLDHSSVILCLCLHSHRKVMLCSWLCQ